MQKSTTPIAKKRQWWSASLVLIILMGALTSCSSVPKKTERNALTREEALTRSQQVTGVSYQLWFGLDQTQLEYQGRTGIQFQVRPGAEKLSDRIFIDFTEGKIKDLRVNGILLDEKQIETRYDGHRIWLRLDELLSGANQIDISFTHPYSTSGDGLHRFQDPEDQRVYLYSNFEPYNARRMFPCFDQPNLKATYELTVEAPAEWTVISSVQEREVTQQGSRKSWIFPASSLFSTYIFPLHAGPYASWKADARGIPMRLFSRQSLAKYVDHKEWFQITRQGLEFFSREFGVHYPFSKYDQILVPDFNAGAMENVAAVTFNEMFVFRSRVTDDRHLDRAMTILHEMAHMWFGNLVTMEWWNGLWLNESFASWAQVWSTAGATRFGKTSKPWQEFFSSMKRPAYWEDQLVTTHPIEVPVPTTEEAFAIFDHITYGKGASVLKQLYSYLGEDKFKAGLRSYFRKHAFQNTTLADFIQSLSDASKVNLIDWQDQWLKTAGVNTLKVRYTCTPQIYSKSKSVIQDFHLDQIGSQPNETLRSHRTQIALYQLNANKRLKRIATHEASYSGATTAIPKLVGQPCPDFVFPNHQDLDYVKIKLDPQSLKTLRKSLSTLEDSLTRQVLWHTLWEMVVDGDLSAQDYLEIAIDQITQEKDTLVLSEVLNHLKLNQQKSSALLYLDPELLGKIRSQIEKLSWERLRNAPAQSDLQLLWLGAFLSNAHSESALNRLEGWLSQKQALPGLEMEQDRRWEIIVTLARENHPQAQDWISREAAEDPSDRGTKLAILASASIPKTDLHTAWLHKILKVDTLNTDSLDAPNTSILLKSPLKDAQLRYAMYGFHRSWNADLAIQSLEPFFENLDRLSQKEPEEYSSAFAETMLPLLCSVDLERQISKYLKNQKGLPASVVKALRVHAQEESRCIKAREVSASANNQSLITTSTGQ